MIMRSSVLVLAGLAGVFGAPGRAAAGVTVSIALPQLIVVAGTDVRYCDDCDEDVFFHRNVWYVYRSGGWYRRSAWGDSWTIVRIGYLPDAFMQVPPGRFKHRYGDRRWHPGHHHHPKMDTWHERSRGRAEPRREAARGDRHRERERVHDNSNGGEKPKQKEKQKGNDRGGKKGRDNGSKGGRGNP